MEHKGGDFLEQLKKLKYKFNYYEMVYAKIKQRFILSTMQNILEV